MSSPLVAFLLICSILFPVLVLAQVPSGTGVVQPTDINGVGSVTSTVPSFCPGGFGSITEILNYFTCLISGSVVPLLMSIATIMFIWGVIQYVINAEDSTKREEGRNFIIWGIIGLFVLVSIWGIVKLLTVTFGFNNVIPQLQE